MQKKCIKIGCRPSALAITQAKHVKNLLEINHPNYTYTIHTYKTEGDINQQDSLQSLGGKNIFIKNLEDKLLDHRVDLLVHSLKDVTAKLHPSLDLAGYLEGPSQRDCLILKNKQSIQSIHQLPKNCRIGSSSIRRKAQLKKLRPDIKVYPIRGNIDTRIKKLHSESLDGIMLAEAGLIRLNLSNHISLSLPEDVFIPAPNQGYLGLEIRSNDKTLKKICHQLTNHKTYHHIRIQQHVIQALNINCNTPFGGFIQDLNSHINYHYFIASDDLKTHQSGILKLTKPIHFDTLTEKINVLKNIA